MGEQKQGISKKIKYISIIVSALVVISTLIFVFIINKEAKDFRVYFVTSGKESDVVFSYNGLEYNSFSISNEKAKRMELKIVDKLEEIEGVTLWLAKNDEILLEKELVFEKDKCVIDLSGYASGEYEVSIELITKDGKMYYVSNDEVFEEIVTNKEVENQYVIQVADIVFNNDIIINKPFIWKTQGKRCEVKGNIVFDSVVEGDMKIFNSASEDIEAEHIFCNTPLWDYEISNIFGEFSEDIFYYINAHSVNGKSIDTTKIRIKNEEELRRLMRNNVLDVGEQVDCIIFEGEYDIGSIVFEKPVNIEIIGNIEVTKSINFTFIDTTKISIDTSKNNVDLSGKIIFDTPNTNIVWNGEDAVGFEYVKQYMNVAGYNTNLVSKYIGGEGKNRVNELTINGIATTIDGNYIYVKTSYSNPVNMDGAILKAKSDSDGATGIVCEDGKHYITIEDDNGKIWGYELFMETPTYTLPVVYIITDSGEGITSKSKYVTGTFSIDYNGSEEYVNIENVPINIRGRGNSTWKLDKKPYKIKFEDKTSLFGLEEAKDWVLLANHVDRTLIRNTVALETAKLLDNFLFVPSSYPVDVFVNGEYQGIYTLGEQIEIKSGRIEIEGDKNSTEVDTDYLIEWGGQGEVTSFGNNQFATDMHMSIEVKNPDADILTKEQFDYIVNYIYEADEAVVNLDGYEEYIDIPSLIDWFLIYEFSYNTDGIFRRSDFFLKKQGDKLYAAAPWDFDYAFGNFYMDVANAQGWICLGNANTDAYEGKYIKANWITYLLNDESFKEQLKARWNEVGEEMYSTAMLTIDEMQVKMGVSIDENFTVWRDVLGTKIQYETRRTSGLATYEEQVEYLREFIEKRYSWMDKTINEM